VASGPPPNAERRRPVAARVDRQAGPRQRPRPERRFGGAPFSVDQPPAIARQHFCVRQQVMAQGHDLRAL
jgi:hypothetical protein